VGKAGLASHICNENYDEGCTESSRYRDLVGRLTNIEGAALGVAPRHSPAATRSCQHRRNSMTRVGKTGHLRPKTVERSLLRRPAAWLRMKVYQIWKGSSTTVAIADGATA
jgi:hypothetical protein